VDKRSNNKKTGSLLSGDRSTIQRTEIITQASIENESWEIWKDTGLVEDKADALEQANALASLFELLSEMDSENEKQN